MTSWSRVSVKGSNNAFVLDSGWGIRFDRLKAEFGRIEKYSALGHLANALEVIEYQKWKERQENCCLVMISMGGMN